MVLGCTYHLQNVTFHGMPFPYNAPTQFAV
ncbi:uncharacterized protein METZ01_LOCUS239040 [marine metagenome]|uniref:Uncharacterized protein n=1 Tax=marine metagenome TaxID=408172 RepID=A0A382HFZ2_9ZZZZ